MNTALTLEQVNSLIADHEVAKQKATMDKRLRDVNRHQSKINELNARKESL